MEQDVLVKSISIKSVIFTGKIKQQTLRTLLYPQEEKILNTGRLILPLLKTPPISNKFVGNIKDWLEIVKMIDTIQAQDLQLHSDFGGLLQQINHIDFSSLKWLIISNQENLRSAQYLLQLNAKNVEKLYLGGNKLTSCRSIRKFCFPHLNSLSLVGNHFEDLSCLSELMMTQNFIWLFLESSNVNTRNLQNGDPRRTANLQPKKTGQNINWMMKVQMSTLYIFWTCVTIQERINYRKNNETVKTKYIEVTIKNN